jgi:hypothetical protein
MQFFLSFLYAHYYVFKMKIKYMQKLMMKIFISKINNRGKFGKIL